MTRYSLSDSSNEDRIQQTLSKDDTLKTKIFPFSSFFPDFICIVIDTPLLLFRAWNLTFILADHLHLLAHVLLKERPKSDFLAKLTLRPIIHKYKMRMVRIQRRNAPFTGAQIVDIVNGGEATSVTLFRKN